jgi:hypothetical protein
MDHSQASGLAGLGAATREEVTGMIPLRCGQSTGCQRFVKSIYSACKAETDYSAPLRERLPYHYSGDVLIAVCGIFKGFGGGDAAATAHPE